jgi:hypothetical protein
MDLVLACSGGHRTAISGSAIIILHCDVQSLIIKRNCSLRNGLQVAQPVQFHWLSFLFDRAMPTVFGQRLTIGDSWCCD